MNDAPQNSESNESQSNELPVDISPQPASEAPDWLAQALPPIERAPRHNFGAPPTVPPNQYAAPPIPSPQPYQQAPQPPANYQQIPPAPQGDGTGGLIPYKNPQALAGYYISVFGLIPCVGFVLGPVAFVLGMRGLKFAQQNPHAKGTAHAWVAMVLGTIEFLAHIAVALMSLGSVR